MPEELSPESKLYIKEEIEKVRKEFKGDLKDAQSKATKIFSTVAMIIGLVTGIGVYLGINNSIKEKLNESGLSKLVESAKDANDTIQGIKISIEQNLPELLKLKSFEYKQDTDNDGYAWVGDIKIIWGSVTTTKNGPQSYEFGHGGFPNACFAVVPSLAGVPHPIPTSDPMNKTHFKFQRLSDFGKNEGGRWLLTYVAIGN